MLPLVGNAKMIKLGKCDKVLHLSHALRAMYDRPSWFNFNFRNRTISIRMSNQNNFYLLPKVKNTKICPSVRKK